MTLLDLFRSGQLLWGLFLLIAVGFLLGSLKRYQRSRLSSDLPRLISDAMVAFVVVLAVLHLGVGIPLPSPLLVLYGLVLAVLFVYRMRVVNQVLAEVESRQKAMAEANRAKSEAVAAPEEADAENSKRGGD